MSTFFIQPETKFQLDPTTDIPIDGSKGKFLILSQLKLKFGFWPYKKRWHTSLKFQFDKTSNKKVIAKKPLTNLYEMNSSWAFCNSIVPHKASICRKPTSMCMFNCLVFYVSVISQSIPTFDHLLESSRQDNYIKW